MFGRLSHQFDQWEEAKNIEFFWHKFFDQQVELIRVIETDLDAAQKNWENGAYILDVPDQGQGF